MTSPVFEHLASSLIVRVICDPLGPDVMAGSDVATIEECLDPGSDPALDPLNDPSRVVDANGRTIGILWFGDWFEEDPWTVVDEVIDAISPNDLVASTTTILDAVELFAKQDDELFYVLHVNQVIGVLRYSNLFKPLGRLAFLALALEIEDLALRLCQFASTAERCWLSLPEGRKRKATRLYGERYPDHGKRSRRRKRSVARLIECTNLIDKANMIWKQKLISMATRSEVLGVLHNVMKVRNLCAHPGSERNLSQELPKERLADFITKARQLRSSLSDAVQERECAGDASLRDVIII